MNPLIQLLEHGQSYWLDNLTRAMIESGELERRVREEGLRGVTSNPAIFSKAISGGGEYDEQIARLSREGRTVPEIYEEVVVSDIRDACDVLRPVYDESGGRDGFVSLEVSPHLAHDTRGSIEEGRRLFRAVDRPNVLIKIPGTPEGVPAIEELLYEGVNVNVTLLFSVEAYEAVARAYLRALERRLEDGSDVESVASVASFFLSRIDVLLDRILGHHVLPEGGDPDGPAPEDLLGRAGVANAKIAYRRFRELFGGERWERLRAEGAAPQRMLWASTSTKNPLYSDVKYVEPLIGPHTVNTLPERTIEAFADHGSVGTTVEDGTEEAREVMRALGELGIDFEQVTGQLLHEGVEKFVDPYDRLMAVLGERRRAFAGGAIGAATFSLAGLDGRTGKALDALDESRFAERMRAGNPSPWARDAGRARRVRQRLGWLEAVETFRDRTPELAELAAEVRDEGWSHLLVLGMGGSVLAAETLFEVLGGDEGAPEPVVLDDTHPEAVRGVEERIDLERTLFLVASKSGTTLETTSLFRHFWARAEERLGEAPGDRFLAVTDPGTPLAREARERGFRRCFENPADVGGRYSALTWFGLVPAALAGADPAALLERAGAMEAACDPALPSRDNPGVRLGAALGMAARRGRDKVTVFTSPALAPLHAWLEQLLAESLGKDGRGVVPVEGERPAVPDAYGDDRFFVHLSLEGSDDGGVGALLSELNEAGHPTVRIRLPDRAALGGEFFRWEVATATAGAVLGVDPFDEPDVEATKEAVEEILGAAGAEGPPEGEPVAEGRGLRLYGDTSWLPAGEEGPLARLAGAARPGDYLAVLSWVPPTPERWEALRAIRRGLWSGSGVPVVVNRGPRYLHSTGQLHKGGPGDGLYLVVTAPPGEDVPIPGAGHGFAALNRAQALADQRILESRGRRVLRVDLTGDVLEGLDALLEELSPRGAPAPAAAGS